MLNNLMHRTRRVYIGDSCGGGGGFILSDGGMERMELPINV